jgi:hypothetical protein
VDHAGHVKYIADSNVDIIVQDQKQYSPKPVYFTRVGGVKKCMRRRADEAIDTVNSEADPKSVKPVIALADITSNAGHGQSVPTDFSKARLHDHVTPATFGEHA